MEFLTKLKKVDMRVKRIFFHVHALVIKKWGMQWLIFMTDLL